MSEKNATLIEAMRIHLSRLTDCLVKYEADAGSEDLKDQGPLLLNQFRELIEEAESVAA
jgi:hypothetical protein